MNCSGVFKKHDEVLMSEREWGFECPVCKGVYVKPDEPKYEQATADDPHEGELFRYPPQGISGFDMVMYRGGETWVRNHGADWKMIKPWRPIPETRH